MTGFLGKAHLISLCLFAVFTLALYKFLRRRTKVCRRAVLTVLSFAGIPSIVWYPIYFGDLLRFLPLELCSYTAILLPVAVLTGNRKLNNLLLLWSVGAFSAILLNPLETSWSPNETEFWMFYVPHVVETAVPPLTFALGLSRKDPRCIPFTVGCTFAAYSFSHVCNQLINSHYVRIGSEYRVNYMFAEWPENPVLDACWKILPGSYRYVFVMTPFIVLFLIIIYLPEIIGKKRNNR